MKRKLRKQQIKFFIYLTFLLKKKNKEKKKHKIMQHAMKIFVEYEIFKSSNIVPLTSMKLSDLPSIVINKSWLR